MRSKATNKRKFVPTSKECEILLFIDCPTMKCPICNKKMIWHKSLGELRNVISLQHNNNGTVNFICYGCNAAHGASQLGDSYFCMPKNYKYCSSCKNTLLTDKFHRYNNSRDGYAYICKRCHNLKSKIGYYNKKL